MDGNADTLLMNAGLTTSGVALLLIVYRVGKAIQGKKLVSSCCGRTFSAGVAVVEMTPRGVEGVEGSKTNPPQVRIPEEVA